MALAASLQRREIERRNVAPLPNGLRFGSVPVGFRTQPEKTRLNVADISLGFHKITPGYHNNTTQETQAMKNSTDKNHVVLFSGGIGSAFAAKRIVDQYGTDGVTLLFCDTKMEDEELYTFLDAASKWIGVPVTTIADGRNPWEVFRDVRFIGNSRVDPCSRVLKRDLSTRWIKERFAPDETTIVIGIDWTEVHRFERFSARKKEKGWTSRAPLCEAPYLSKKDMFAALKKAKIPIPRLYFFGHGHNNCGGFCCKAGKASFAILLRTNRKRYLWHEEKERELREMLGDYAILSTLKDGEKTPLSLQAFREQLDRQPDLSDSAEWKYDFGGCGCAIE